MLTGRTNAPEVNTRHGWLNTDREWSIKDFRGKIKMLDLHRNRVRTVVAGLEEPNDVLFMDGKLWATDTNRHQLLRIDLSTGEKEAVAITEAVAG